MTDQSIKRLVAADPAADLAPLPDELLLQRTLALPREHREHPAGRRRPRLVLPAAAISLGVVLTASVLLADGDRSSPPTAPARPAQPKPLSLALAAQAYANTTPIGPQIVYSRIRSDVTFHTSTPQGSTGVQRATGTIEEWHRGRETHRLERYDATATEPAASLDHVIDRHGVMRQIDENGRYRIIRKSDGSDAAHVIAGQQAGFIADFRARYEKGELDPTADVRFNGRPARRYVVDSSPGGPAGAELGQEQAFYIDRETGEPLGATTTSTAPVPRGSTERGPVVAEGKLLVESIKLLPPTPANLRVLHTLTLLQRRDASGCIRGPLINRQRSDAASKRDCGGPPNAPIP
jgi:hypothetical protein